MIKTVRCAPSCYNPPPEKRLAGDLLEETVKSLKAEQQPIRELIEKNMGTIVSDGWDDVERNHLINFLLCSNTRVIFDGTIELRSDEHENAATVAKFIMQAIERAGPVNIFQVVTDTCATLKSAWKIIEKEYPWVTCTPCAAHCLSLLLKDISKIEAVGSLMSKAKILLTRFCGHKRWPRKRLREVIEKNHKRKFGLYRAKATRFAGHVRELARLLRVKSDLQEVVISADYKDWFDKERKKTRGKNKEDGDARTEDNGDAAEQDAFHTTATGGDAVKQLVLDEDSFWPAVIEVLQVCTPIVLFLRLCDGNKKPAMGKVYDRMFQILQSTKGSTAAWADQAASMVEERWEYMHSPMHSAAFVLDPEFLNTKGEQDEATQSGLLEIILKAVLRDKVAASVDPDAARREMSIEDVDVQMQAAEVHRQLARYHSKEGVFSSVAVRLNAKTMTPATWWSMYGSNLSELRAVALRVLAQPVSASAAERNWSEYGSIKTKSRSRLGHETADKLVYCHESIHLRNECCKAGYKEPFEKWQFNSDDEDDGSDTEEDLTLTISQLIV